MPPLDLNPGDATDLNCGPTVTHDIVSAQQRTVLSTGAKVIGHESCLWSEGSTGAKVPWNESSRTFRSSGANVPWNESSTGAKVISMVFSLPGTKVQRNEKASYLLVAM